jgi:hypothetical protein
MSTYWDDAWHTDRTRDSFFVPPHLGIYGGVLVATAITVVWAWHNWRREGRRSFRFGSPVLSAFSGAVAALASGPIDDIWHQAFGRDAVLWSPPHALAVASTVALGAGLAAGLPRHGPRYLGVTRLVAGALILGSLLVPVMEYETDVPQFSLAWYLPVTSFGLVAASLLIQRIEPSRWAATRAAVVTMTIRGATIVLLLALGHSLVVLVPVVVVALLIDLLATQRRVRWGPLVVPVVIHAIYLPWIWVMPGIEVPIAPAMLISLVASILATSIAVLATAESSVRPGRGLLGSVVVTLVALGFVVATARPATAHDPGQGRDIAELFIEAQPGSRSVDVRATGSAPCDKLQPKEVVARRAGKVRRTALVATGDCQWVGRVETGESGRWFVYVVFGQGTVQAEAWVPIAGDPVSEQRPLYVPPPRPGGSGQAVAGVVLYLAAATVLILGLRVRSDHARSPTATR